MKPDPQDSLPVVVAVGASAAKSLPPETTAEQDLKTLGQRKVNLLWETTQAIIAVGVTAAMIYAAMTGKESPALSNAFTLIISIYFVRMNHTKVGGVGGTDSR